MLYETFCHYEVLEYWVKKICSLQEPPYFDIDKVVMSKYIGGYTF